MKKKILCILLVCMMALLTACGASDDSSKPESAESSSEDADADAEVEDEENTEEESGELNEYGLTAEQQEALLASVQASVTEEYLEKYNIPAADFKLLPYDVNDLNNYDSSGQYTGADPYECTLVWMEINNTILWSDFGGYLPAASEVEKEMLVEMLSEKDFTLGDTLEEQNQKNSETGVSYALDTSTEHYNLTNAVYMGIAKFLNQLDQQERTEVLYELYVISDKNAEWVLPDNSGQQVRTTTMFDKVISENIQFE